MLANMGSEKFQSAFAGDSGTYRIETCPVVAIEAVPGGVHVDRQFRVCGFDFLDVLQRDGVILLAEMENYRTSRLFCGDCANTATIIAGTGGETIDPG